MKKNEFATFIVYLAMFGIALAVGFAAIKPIITDRMSSLPMHPALIMVLGLIVGVLVNAIALELCHVLGAKLGKYRVLKVTVLGASFTRINGQRKFRLSGFDGLTGETKVVPEDVEKSSLNAYIFFPILFLFLEFIACMVGIVLCQNTEASEPSVAWARIFLITILTVGGMIYFYDLFPAYLESTTDGFLLTLLNKPANKVAFNNLLLAQGAVLEGKPLPETPVYTELTDFTASLNMISVYHHLSEGQADKALEILEPMLSEEAHISAASVNYARTLKLTILLEAEDRTKGKKFYEELDDQAKKYIADVTNLVALRAYLLIATFIEDSESEANYAIDKAEKAIKACNPDYKDVEKSLLQMDVDLAREVHPSWDVYKLPWEKE